MIDLKVGDWFGVIYDVKLLTWHKIDEIDIDRKLVCLDKTNSRRHVSLGYVEYLISTKQAIHASTEKEKLFAEIKYL